MNGIQVVFPDLHLQPELRQAGKLGEYLLAATGACDEAAIQRALERQADLRTKGYNTLLGILLLDAGVITKKELAQALKQQDIDRLATSAIFHSLPRKNIVEIYDKSIRKVIAPHETIFRQHDLCDAVHVILQGTVSLIYKPQKGMEVDLAVLHSGEVFGEMSILTDSPRFVTARAVEQTNILVVPKDVFLTIYQQSPMPSRAAIRRWFHSIVEGRMQSQVYQEQHYKELLSKMDTRPCVPLLGRSRKARQIRKRVDDIAGSGQSVLLVGEPGTMKTRVAQYIYENAPDREGSFIIFNPAKVPSFVSEGLGREKDGVYSREVEQMAALFGYEKDMFSAVTVPWQGYLKLAHRGTLVISNVSELEPKVQRLLVDYLKTGMFYPMGANRPVYSSTRVVVKAIDDLDLENEVYECFLVDNIYLDPLRNRKRDLKEIVSLLVEEISRERNKPVKNVDQEAVNKIMAYGWPGNYRELEEVLSRAVSLSDGQLLNAEDIFIGKVPITGKTAFNLLNIKAVRYFFQSPFYPIAPQIFIACMFLIVIALGVWGNPSPDSNISLLLVWANWEPLVILSCLLMARIWCSFCPIGFIGDLFSRLRQSRLKIDARYLNYGYFVSALGLALVFWSQAALDMWEKPAETAWLLIAMLSFAIVFALFFEGHIWCRYVCPLGQMVATFARISVVEIRSNYNYCSYECSSYDCFSGRGDIPGCKMAKGPFAMDTNQDCVLCGNCIKTCPNQSVRVNLRPPGWELWNARTADLAMILFVPLLWGTQIFRGLDLTDIPDRLANITGSPGGAYGLLMLGAAAFAYHVALAGVVFTGKIDTDAGPRFGSTFFLAMLPLVYANEIAIRLVPLLNHAADFFVIFGNQIGYDFPQIAFRLDMQSIHFLQIVLIFVGLLFSIFIAGRLTKMLAPEKAAPAFFRHLPLFVMAVVSVILL